jgi:hypothetical protein
VFEINSAQTIINKANAFIDNVNAKSETGEGSDVGLLVLGGVAMCTVCVHSVVIFLRARKHIKKPTNVCRLQ